MKNLLLFKIIDTLAYIITLIVKNALFCGRTIFETIADHYYEKKLGINTYGNYEEKEDTGIYGDEIAYIPTNYISLKKMLDYLQLDKNDVFIDLGCGKGRAIILVGTQKLKKIIGVELRKSMLDIAKKNLASVKINNTKIEIVHADAAEADLKEGTVYFMYKPFKWQTTKRVLENIKESLNSNPRPIRIIYINREEYGVMLDMADWLVAKGEIDNSGVFVWSNR
jgi:precorrin-6B methylase 2